MVPGPAGARDPGWPDNCTQLFRRSLKSTDEAGAARLRAFYEELNNIMKIMENNDSIFSYVQRIVGTLRGLVILN